VAVGDSNIALERAGRAGRGRTSTRAHGATRARRVVGRVAAHRHGQVLERRDRGHGQRRQYDRLERLHTFLAASTDAVRAEGKVGKGG
jgi:hypothetical protein